MTLNIHHLEQAARGMTYAHAGNRVLMLESSVRQGRNYYYSALMQSFEACYVANRVFEQMDKNQISFDHQGLAKWGTVATVLLAAIVADSKLPSAVRKVALLIHDHVSKVLLLVQVGVAVSVMALGNIAFGIGALSFYGLGLLDRSGILPSHLRILLHKSHYVIGNLAALAFGDPFIQLLAIIDIVSVIAERLFGSDVFNRGARQPTFEKVTLDDTCRDIRGAQELKVTQDHIHLYGYIPAPDVKIEQLVKWGKEVSQGQLNLSSLEQKLSQDQRFRDFGEQGKEVKFFNDNLSIYVNRVVKREILEGEINDYDTLEYYLKHITQHVNELRQQGQKVDAEDILMRLAIEGGQYCGPGALEVAEDIYRGILEKQGTSLEDDTSLNVLLNARLTLLRRKIFRDHYQEVNSVLRKNWLGRLQAKFIDPNDMHTYNHITWALESSLKLGAASALNDSVATRGWLSRLLHQKMFAPFRWMVWETYEKTLLDWCYQNPLPPEKVTAWWKEYLEKLPKGRARDALFEKLEEGEFFEGEKKNILKRGYLKAMLHHLGVLERV